jgi:hypothetical protein
MDEVRRALEEAAAALDEVVRHSDAPRRSAAADARIALSQVRSAIGARHRPQRVPRHGAAGAGGESLHLALHWALAGLETASHTGLSVSHKELLRRAVTMLRAMHSEFSHRSSTPSTGYRRGCARGR